MCFVESLIKMYQEFTFKAYVTSCLCQVELPPCILLQLIFVGTTPEWFGKCSNWLHLRSKNKDQGYTKLSN